MSRALLVLNPVDDRRRAVTAAVAAEQHRFTTAVYQLQNAPSAPRHAVADESGAPAAIVDWLKSHP